MLGPIHRWIRRPVELGAPCQGATQTPTHLIAFQASSVIARHSLAGRQFPLFPQSILEPSAQCTVVLALYPASTYAALADTPRASAQASWRGFLRAGLISCFDIFQFPFRNDCLFDRGRVRDQVRLLQQRRNLFDHACLNVLLCSAVQFRCARVEVGQDNQGSRTSREPSHPPRRRSTTTATTATTQPIL
jgi:hypothetical protein